MNGDLDKMNEENPGLEPALIVIFGITGDLAQRKLLPALYHLFKDGLLHEQTEIIGLSRRKVTTEDIIDLMKLCVLESDNTCDPTVIAKIKKSVHMRQFDLTNGEDYKQLRDYLDKAEDAHGVCMNRLYYLSIPPQVYSSIIRNLGEHGLDKGCRHNQADSRLLVEKPFGYDLVSAEELIAETAKSFREEQVFRIDHYLAKETAQNILAFRMNNPVFANSWSSRFIKSISIVASEKIGIEGRANFYDNVGALRDLVQSHLLQLLALTTMELPEDMTNHANIHAAKYQLLSSIEPVQADEIPTRVVRAQYRGYREEVGSDDSTTETFVSLQLHIDTPKWRHLPVTITTGKGLADKKTEIRIVFAQPNNNHSPNELTFRIQPNEGIDVRLNVKQPGFDYKVQQAAMDFSYRQTFSDNIHPDAYERIIVDAIRGDHSLFASSEEVLASWRILQNILDKWQQDSSDLQFYKLGSDGPLTA